MDKREVTAHNKLEVTAVVSPCEGIEKLRLNWMINALSIIKSHHFAQVAKIRNGFQMWDFCLDKIGEVSLLLVLYC